MSRPSVSHGPVPHLVRQVLDLGDEAERADGVAPFSEQPLLDLRRHEGSDDLPTVLITQEGEIVTGAVLSTDDDPNSAELAVAPAQRRRGLGRALVQAALAQDPTRRFWAHGNLAPAQALAAECELVVVRELWRMERPVAETDGDPVDLPDGYRARAFVPGQDEEAWLRVNARAFVDHPEQGRMTRSDLDDRMAEPWFDPEGLILVVDEDDRLAASHWVKVPPGESTGEVYVVAVDPDHQGRGLGGPLTRLGLQRLRRVGVQVVDLYVDADNSRAVATYRRLGFETAAVDAMYAWRSPDGATIES